MEFWIMVEKAVLVMKFAVLAVTVIGYLVWLKKKAIQKDSLSSKK